MEGMVGRGGRGGGGEARGEEVGGWRGFERGGGNDQKGE